MNDATKRARVVARIMASEDKGKAIAAEAQRLGKHARTIERWVADVQAAQGGAGQDAVSKNATPTEKTPENPVLDSLLKDEGADPAKKTDAQPPVNPAAGLKDMENSCVEAFNGLKSAGGSVLVSVKYSPPLDGTSPEVLNLLKIGWAAETAIRANAPKLYPIIIKHAGTWGALIGAIAVDAVCMIASLEGLAKSKGWVPGPKKARDQGRQVDIPTVQEYGEALRPKPAPDPEPPIAAAKPGMDTVVNAPLPTEEAVKKVDDIRAVLTGTAA